MGQLTLVINSLDTADTLNAFVQPSEGNQYPTMSRIENLISAMNGGIKDIEDGLIVFGEPATATIVMTGLPTAADTVTINGVAFTARASGAVANEFNIGASAALTAAALAASINASVSNGIADVLTAEASSGTVTLTSLITGKFALGYTISESMANTTVTAWAITAETSRTSF